MRASPPRLRARSHRPGRCRCGDSRISAPARRYARRGARAAPRCRARSPEFVRHWLRRIACRILYRTNGIMSRPRAAANRTKNRTARRLRLGLSLRQRVEHGVRGVRNDGEQRPSRSARGALALLPVADGLDGTPSFAANCCCVRWARRRRSRTVGALPACPDGNSERAAAQTPARPAIRRSVHPL